MVLLISYDLRNHERPGSYTRVKEYIERHSKSAIRPLYSQWFVDTEAGPQAWVDALRKNELVDSDDHLFICPITRPRQGLLSQADWAWLNART